MAIFTKALHSKDWNSIFSSTMNLIGIEPKANQQKKGYKENALADVVPLLIYAQHVRDL